MATSDGWRAAIIGAAAGGLVGFIFFSRQGQEFRRGLEPAVDGVLRELRALRRTVEKAASAASEGYGVVNDVIGQARVGRTRPSRLN